MRRLKTSLEKALVREPTCGSIEPRGEEALVRAPACGSIEPRREKIEKIIGLLPCFRLVEKKSSL